METIISENRDVIAELRTFVKGSGPEQEQYPEFEYLLNQAVEQFRTSELSDEQMLELTSQCAFLKDCSTIMGHIRQKPHGYAGDFEIIDRIYLSQCGNNGFKGWDEYALQHPAAQAVRNRKKYFKTLLENKLKGYSSISLLNIASGPGRDMLEAFQGKSNLHELKVECVEMDAKAVAHARKLNTQYLDNITFNIQNVLRYQTSEKYDLIWSAGLFDYFSDKVFVKLLSNFIHWLAPGGEVVIGNFNSEHNPSRFFMEVFGDWHLNHRSEQQLLDLAVASGALPHQVSIGREEENINLFLHIKAEPAND